MKLRTLIAATLVGTLVLAGCHRNNRESQIAKIDALEDSLTNAGFVVDDSLATQMVDLLMQFVKDNPKDTLCPTYLFKASDLYNVLGDYQKAYECVDQVVNQYPDFYNVGFCYFFRGNYLQEMGKGDEAKKAYQLFLDKFPDHPMAHDVKTILDNDYFGLSDEEMFQKIQEKASSENIAVEE